MGEVGNVKQFKPSRKNIFTARSKADTSFVDHLCYLCLVFVMLSRLFIAAFVSPAGKGLTSWLLFVMSLTKSLPYVVSYVVSLVR